MVIPKENSSCTTMIENEHEWKSKHQPQSSSHSHEESKESLEHVFHKHDTIDQGYDIMTNPRNLLALQDVDIPWDVETIQSIMEVQVQNSQYPVLDEHSIWES